MLCMDTCVLHVVREPEGLQAILRLVGLQTVDLALQLLRQLASLLRTNAAGRAHACLSLRTTPEAEWYRGCRCGCGVP